MALREIKVLLPGTETPIVLYSQSSISASEVLEIIHSKYHVEDAKQRNIIRPANSKIPGNLIEPDQLIELDRDEVNSHFYIIFEII
jgi:hypothetical protein